MTIKFAAIVRRYVCGDGKANAELVLCIDMESRAAAVSLDQVSATGAKGDVSFYSTDQRPEDGLTTRYCDIRYSSRDGERAIKLALDDRDIPTGIRQVLSETAFTAGRLGVVIETDQKELFPDE